MPLIDKEALKEKLTALIAIYESRMPKWSPNDPHTSGKDAAVKWGAKADGVEEALRLLDSMPAIHEKSHAKAASIIAHYGTAHQLVKLCEECAELAQQAAKCYDKGIPYSDDMIEEIADVIVMIKQFETVMSQPDRDLLEDHIAYKLRRQLDRIEEEST